MQDDWNNNPIGLKVLNLTRRVAYKLNGVVYL